MRAAYFFTGNEYMGLNFIQLRVSNLCLVKVQLWLHQDYFDVKGEDEID